MRLMLFFLAFCPLLEALTPQEVIQELMEGNQRFYENRSIYTRDMTKKRLSLVEAQHPLCAIVTCADARVTPEIIFDEPLGKLFVIRVAGNVITEGVYESISFAVNHLKVPLVLVIGHENCGLIQAVQNHAFPRELHLLESLAEPFVLPDMSLEQAVISNAKGQAEEAKEKLHLPEEAVKAAYYDFESGKVRFYLD